ncbi:MAG: 7-cyano-7-deazaguanine synthase QueC [Deltaproteobacteria bacterium]|nr:7-cyano-7-deazaguanine synthase QueC [Deltaproteobacteria bacterium]
MGKRISVVLLSGGLDSTVTTAIAAEKGELALLHVSYGQRTEDRERKSFDDIADFFVAENVLKVNASYFKDIGSSALTDTSIEVPEGELEREGVPITYVPFRNANLLCIATSWAEKLGATRVYIGAVEEDSSGYPDCRKSFFEAFNEVVSMGTRPETKIEIVTPLIDMKKDEIVRKGLSLGAPLQLSWSCYKDEDLACGRCDSCLLRLRGFKEAGTEDPIKYRS